MGIGVWKFFDISEVIWDCVVCIEELSSVLTFTSSTSTETSVVPQAIVKADITTMALSKLHARTRITLPSYLHQSNTMAGVRGSRTHPRTGSRPRNGFEDGNQRVSLRPTPS